MPVGGYRLIRTFCTAHCARLMKPFTRSQYPPEAFDPAAVLRKFGHLPGMSPAMAETVAQHSRSGELFINDAFEVLWHRQPALTAGGPQLIHLSFKRRDKQPVLDSEVLPAIRSYLTDPELAAAELFPAESRVVDTANQYHAWLVVDPGFPWPLESVAADDEVLPDDRFVVRRARQDDPDQYHRLSLRRRDGSPERDWRELQQVKNRHLGPEIDAIEVFPGESRRLRDGWFHLYYFPDPTFRFPFGFNGRLVLDAEVVARSGGRQRPLGTAA